jgi:uncharacterized protein involved in exopolysaccharide biosynthesis
MKSIMAITSTKPPILRYHTVMQNESTESHEKIIEERSLLEGLTFYASLIVSRWKFIIIVTAIAAALVLFFSILTLTLPTNINPMPNVYRAYAVIIVDDQDNQELNPVLESFGINEARINGSDFSQTAMTVMRSRSFIDQLVQDLNIIEEFKIENKPVITARQLVASKTEINYNQNSRTLIISSIDKDRDFAQRLVNSTVALLEKWYQEEGGSRSARQLTLLEDTLNDLSEKISGLEARIKDFQLEYNTLNVDELAETQNAMLNDLRTELVQVEIEIRNYSSFSRVEDPALLRLKTQRENILNLVQQIENGYSGTQETLPSRSQLPQLQLEFAKLSTDLRIQMSIYETVSQRYELERISAVDSTPFYVLEYAERPLEKYGPSRARLSILVTFLAMFAAVGYIIAKHIFDSMFTIGKGFKQKQKPNKKKDESK